MGPPEEDSPPDHADAGAVTQNIFEARRIVTADHCGAAGHEFGEGIPRAPQNPELRRFEAGVVLRHRHAAGADVARHIDLALGHGVSGSVGGIAANDDAGAGIEPAHIIRDGTENVDGRAGKAHRADALSGRAEDADQKLILFPRLPESSANTVLAVRRGLRCIRCRPRPHSESPPQSRDSKPDDLFSGVLTMAVCQAHLAGSF